MLIYNKHFQNIIEFEGKLIKYVTPTDNMGRSDGTIELVYVCANITQGETVDSSIEDILFFNFIDWEGNSYSIQTYRPDIEIIPILPPRYALFDSNKIPALLYDRFTRARIRIVGTIYDNIEDSWFDVNWNWQSPEEPINTSSPLKINSAIIESVKMKSDIIINGFNITVISDK